MFLNTAKLSGTKSGSGKPLKAEVKVKSFICNELIAIIKKPDKPHRSQSLTGKVKRILPQKQFRSSSYGRENSFKNKIESKKV